MENLKASSRTHRLYAPMTSRCCAFAKIRIHHRAYPSAVTDFLIVTYIQLFSTEWVQKKCPKSAIIAENIAIQHENFLTMMYKFF